MISKKFPCVRCFDTFVPEIGLCPALCKNCQGTINGAFVGGSGSYLERLERKLKYSDWIDDNYRNCLAHWINLIKKYGSDKWGTYSIKGAKWCQKDQKWIFSNSQPSK